ncbi:unnamed protein product [Triticum turgidum subsp. durum]|uniref:RBR-type E3 ubiquitin transferase n=2 Tax=Triticinae TaxID=1648030 RepID=A0A9R1RCC6_TRITD|nr:unnamed protein product [Triticum turgidum subsp. durum]
MPPRKSWKPKGGSRGPAQRPHGKSAAAPYPNPAHEYPYDASAAAAAAEALERLDVSAAAEEDPPVETPPSPPQPEVPAPAPPSQPPVEASSSGSGSAAAGGGREEGALRRLRELVGIGREEVELTEEEVRANDQRQDDEICALEAIFGDTVVMLNRKEGQRTFQVHVHIEIPDGTDVSARLSFGAGTLNYKGAHDEDASDDLVYKFRVEHLPPILLTCLLPSSYPSHQPPFFTLSTEWLDKVMLSSLCHMLDMIWEEQLGMEVVYQWVQWLQSSSLSYLGFDNEIVLSKGDLTCVEDGGDNRACPDDAPPDLTIPRIIRYNDDKRHEAFLHGIHDCMICFSELPGVDFIKLPCHHFFCQKCMQTYCKMHVKEGTVVKLLCPDTKCEGVVPPNILKRLLGEDEFERWEGLLLQRTLDAMADVVYCPRCQTACLEDVGDEAVCSSCLFSFCTLCRERRHVGVECLSPEEKLIILERRQKSGQVKGDIQKVMDEVRSIKEILKDAKQCPRCKMAISKIEGCNKMTCWNCGRFFCYQCNAAISGYDHFKGDCVVFDQEEIDRWEMQMNQRQQRQVVAQAQAEIFEGEYGYPCPTCRNPIPKIGNNNHLYCWACQRHFCALCRKVVLKTSQHFGPRGCKQHTADD